MVKLLVLVGMPLSQPLERIHVFGEHHNNHGGPHLLGLESWSGFEIRLHLLNQADFERQFRVGVCSWPRFMPCTVQLS